MKFSGVVDQARALLQRTGKLTYRMLKREFALYAEALEDLKDQLINAEEVAADKDGKMLVWKGDHGASSAPREAQGASAAPTQAPSPASYTPAHLAERIRAEQAAHYALDRRAPLSVFLADPTVPLDTNHLERQIRAIALGRRNWLFCWTEVGAQYVGIGQSLLASCRLQRVDPYVYLVDVLQRIDAHPRLRGPSAYAAPAEAALRRPASSF